MAVSSFPDRVKTIHVIIGTILLVSINVVFNLLPFNAQALEIINAAFEVLYAILVAASLMLIYSVAHKNHYIFSRTLLWMALTMIGWAAGDALYLYLTFIKVDPFISPTDIFYITASLLMIVSVLTISHSMPASRRRNMVFIEISILVLSATVIFSILMLAPGKANLNFDPLTLLMVFIYPVLDIILIWVVVIMYFTFPLRSSQKVISVLFAGVMCIFMSDLIYLINNLYANIVEDFVIDIGYYLYYSLLLISGLIGFKEIRERSVDTEKKVTSFKTGNWIVYLPGVFLIIVIGLLMVFVINQTFILFHGVVVLIALIIILFIIHQYLVIADNIKLTREMKLINAQLENKVELRTAELSKANMELQDEMKEREKAEEHLAQSNQDLALLNRDKDKFFTILAHDLRSPLGSMMKLSELLVDNINDFNEEELLEVAVTLNNSATQTFQLLNDLLAWSAVQMGRGESEKMIFPVSDIVTENTNILSAEANKKQITIHSAIDPAIVVFADKVAIQTVLRNLMSNAIKFTKHEGLVTITAEADNNFVKISVTDTGVGIPKDKQKQMFKVDSVSSSPGTDGEKGTGFGLLLCKDLVEKNGGEIWLESEKGKGSSFRFTVPATEVKSISVDQRNFIPSGKIELNYDHTKKMGFSTFTGEFNSVVLKSEFRRLWSGTEYIPEYSVLVDLRHATFTIDIKDISEMLDLFTAMPGKHLNRKFALLTTTPQQVAYSTMFGQHIKTNYLHSVEVFSTSEGAINWLGS